MISCIDSISKKGSNIPMIPLSDKLYDHYDVNFIKSMRNAVTHQHVTCNPNQYKYIQLLLNEMIKFDIIKRRKRTTSFDISSDFNKWKDDESVTDKQIRIQIINGSIYLSKQKTKKTKKGLNEYRMALIIYLNELISKYGVYLPNTDIIWQYHDYKIGFFKNLTMYAHKNWILNGTIPYFWSDVNIAYNYPYNNLFLFGLSRSYLKYRYYADFLNDKRYNKYIFNYSGIMDYLQFKELEGITEYFYFQNKTINKALFRGNSKRSHNKYGIRDSLFQTLFINNYTYDTITSLYFDIGDTDIGVRHENQNYKYMRDIDGYSKTEKNLTKRKSFFMSIKQQMLYKYIIVLDGVSVRDSFFYLFKSGAVLLKQLSTYYEWWYYDLINNFHLITFENIMDLIGIVIDIVDAVNGDIIDIDSWHQGKNKNDFEFMLKKNMTKWNIDKLQQITNNAQQFANQYLFNDNNVDCFMIHMIQIYNHYLFDANSVTKDIAMSQLDLTNPKNSRFKM